MTQKDTDKARRGFHAVAGKQVGGIPVHKALALALASKRVPLMQCLTQPIQVCVCVRVCARAHVCVCVCVYVSSGWAC